METVRDVILGGSKITAMATAAMKIKDACSLEGKLWPACCATAAKSLQSCPTVRPHRWQSTRFPRPWDSPGKNTGVGCHFLLLDSTLKSRDITLPTKVCLVKAMVFPVVMYGWESWTIKKPECRRLDAFELWCWQRLLSVPWTARRSNLSIIKEISPEYSLEGLMLKLKLQSFHHLMRRTDSLEKTLMRERLKAGGEGDGRGWDGWMVSPTWWTWAWVGSRSWWWTGKPAVLQSMGSQRVRHDWVTELNWMPTIVHTTVYLALSEWSYQSGYPDH